eukprot:6447195-Pyramimonas_sp.AAC.1
MPAPAPLPAPPPSSCREWQNTHTRRRTVSQMAMQKRRHGVARLQGFVCVPLLFTSQRGPYPGSRPLSSVYEGSSCTQFLVQSIDLLAPVLRVTIVFPCPHSRLICCRTGQRARLFSPPRGRAPASYTSPSPAPAPLCTAGAAGQ